MNSVWNTMLESAFVSQKTSHH